ncbi:hypothetical protein [Maridesulfovibrio frigidus]|uniref:hypothetical protein n=1 Tax=Maridesulfovibrio frigidus TaxID=340956 RepID=UPI0004E1F624|nr:hypothetical protein [Maridesulfovibrio frigidus]
MPILTDNIVAGPPGHIVAGPPGHIRAGDSGHFEPGPAGHVEISPATQGTRSVEATMGFVSDNVTGSIISVDATQGIQPLPSVGGISVDATQGTYPEASSGVVIHYTA